MAQTLIFSTLSGKAVYSDSALNNSSGRTLLKMGEMNINSIWSAELPTA